MKRFVFKVPSFVFISIYITVILIASSCRYTSESSNTEKPIDVDFIKLNPTSAVVEQRFPGSIEGSVNVEVKSQVTGYLDRIYVNEGDYVMKGQPLFQIKGDIFIEQVNNSKAALQAAIVAKNNARLEVDKLKPLVSGKVVSEIQLKTAEANYESACAQVNQAKAALGVSQINAAFCLIKAPSEGYIGRIPNRIGSLITPNDANSLTTLSSIDKVFVYFSISEADFISIQKNGIRNEFNGVELILANGAYYSKKGQIEVASGNIDRTTGSIAMKAIFPNPEKLLRSGGAARIVLKKVYNNVLTIPQSCVKDIQDKLFVFVLKNSTRIVMTPIEICGRTDNLYIVKAGVKTGDRIAINRIDLLNSNVVIKPSLVTGN